MLGPVQVFAGQLVLAAGARADGTVAVAMILVGALLASIGVALGCEDARRSHR